MGIALFFLVLAIILIGLRYFAGVYYDRLHKDENPIRLPQSIKEINTDENTILDDEILGVITAAAFIALKRPAVIKSIKFLENIPNTDWSAYGRIKLMNSHITNK